MTDFPRAKKSNTSPSSGKTSFNCSKVEKIYWF